MRPESQPIKKSSSSGSPDDGKACLAVEEPAAPDETKDDVLAALERERPVVARIEVKIAVVAHEVGGEAGLDEAGDEETLRGEMDDVRIIRRQPSRRIRQ